MSTNLPIGTKVAALVRIPIRDSNIHVLPGDVGEVVAHSENDPIVRFPETDSTHRISHVEGVVSVISNTKYVTALLPQQPQRQDSLRNQLSDLILLANRAGMYDAADWIISKKED